jgi:hypothetical protein
LDNLLLSVGLGCMIAAIVGGGLKAFGVDFPAISTLARQVLLFLFGAALCLLSPYVKHDPQTSLTVPVPPRPKPTCIVTGHVYNSDDQTRLPGAKIFFHSKSDPARWTALATSGPDGSFTATCTDIDQANFPLSIGVTHDSWRCPGSESPFSADGWESVGKAGARDMNLSLSVKYMMRLKIIACRVRQ